MKSQLRKVAVGGVLLSMMTLGLQSDLMAGNKDRVGQAGASQLLINPFARSTGFAGANSASVTGLEATYLNVSGLAFTRKTELMFSRTTWLSGSDVNINSFGFSQRVGETSVIGLGVMSMDFGDIEVTTVDLPEGGSGTFSPQYLNLGLSFAKEFSNSIYGGVTVRTISEAISDANATGVAFDAGIRYVTGEKDNLKFGIALRNVGPKMQYNGDGFSTKVELNGNEFTLEQRTEGFEMPALLNIGVSYDYYVGAKTDSTGKGLVADHRITGAGNFTSNSFGKDQIRIGVEYGFRDYLMLRGGFVYEEDIFDSNERTSVYTGPTAGVTFQVPISKNGSMFSIDYSYQDTNPFDGTHTFGARISI